MVFAFERVGEFAIHNQTLCHQLFQRQLGLAFAGAAGVYGGGGQVVEGLAAAGAAVENAGYFGMVVEEEVYFDYVFHADEVAALRAGGVAVVAAEQGNAAVLAVFVEVVVGHGGHAAFVLLAAAVYVEIAQGNHLIVQPFFHAAAQYLVEQEFGIAIHIERGFQFALFAEGLAFAIHGGGGGMDQADAVVLAPIEQIERVLVVVVHHVHAVVVHGVGASALVEDSFDVAAVDLVGAHLADEFVFVQIVRNIGLHQIAEFVGTAEVVHRDDVGDAAPVERVHDVAADKAGGAGNDDGHELFLITGWRVF